MNPSAPENSSSAGLAKIALIVSLLAAAFALFFRLPSRPQEKSSVGDPGIALGRLNVGVVPAPPASFIDPKTGNPVGYAIDVVRALARRSDLQVNFVPVGWDTMGSELISGKIDVVAGPIFMTESRAREFLFSDPLFSYAVVVLAPKGQASPLQKFQDLKKSGLRVAVGKGGFDAEFVGRALPDARLSVFPPSDPTIPALEVIAGRTDFALMDYGNAAAFVSGHPEVEIKFGAQPVSRQHAGFMFAAGRERLRDFWNISMRNLELAGELDELDAAYAGKKGWHERVNPFPVSVKAP